MTTGTKLQRYKLVGLHAGKTMLVNNHQFEKGEYAYHGSPEQLAGLTRAFSFYAALPIEEAELYELRAEKEAAESQAIQGETDEGEVVKLSLAEAIGQLNGNEDEHWTSNNLPSLEYLATLLGKTPTRAEVNAIADGYTRARAKAAQQ